MKGRNIWIVAGVTLGILVVLEVAARIVLSNIYNRKFDSSLIEPGKYGATDGLKANATGTVWGKPFHTDDMGGRKHQKSKTGKKKVLIIGDSVTEGVGVDDSSTFCNRFNDSKTFAELDVRNISMIGWSTYDYRNVVDHLIGRDSSVSDIIVCYCLNDIYGKTVAADLPSIAINGFASKINGVLQDKYATYKLLKLFLYQNSDRYFKYDNALYHDTKRLDNAVSDLAHIRDTCAVHYVRFYIMILPYKSQLSDRTQNLPDSILADGLKKKFIHRDDLLISWPSEANYDDLYLFADEIHFSEKGHHQIGRFFDDKE